MFKKRKLFYSALTLAAFLLSSCSVSFDISSDNKNNSDSISSETSSIGDSSEPNTSTSTGDNTSSADNNEPIPDTDDHKATPTVKYSALTYGKAPTYNESGSLPYYRGVGTDNNGKYYDTSFNEVNESDLILPSFSSSCPDILDDVFSDDKSTKSNWDAVTNNVEHWTHVPGSYEVLIPEDKAGWQLSKQSYTDIDMKIKIDGLTPMNPFVEGSYITKAFLIGADASKTNGYYPSGYAICLFDNGGDNWLQIYHLDEYNFNDLRGVFVGGIYGDAAHNFNHREIRVKVRGNVLSLYDTDGRQMQIEEGHLGFYTPNLVLEHYKGGKVGILNWTCSNNVDSSFTIKEFSGIKKEDAAKFKVEGVDFDKQNTEKRASVIVLAGQSNMEGNTRAWDNYTTSNYLKNYCNASSDHDYDELETGYDNIQISYHNNFPYAGSGPLGNFTDNRHNYSNEEDFLAGEFIKTKVGEGLSTNYFGPELGIAEQIHKSAPNEKVYIIKFGAGGTNFNERAAWSSPSSGKTGILYGSLTQFVYNNLKLIAEDGYTPVIKALCYMQGESDSNISVDWASNRYKNYLNNMVNDFKNEFASFAVDNNAGNINFIDGKIYVGAGSQWANGTAINTAKQQIADSNTHNFVINESTNYPINGNGYGGGDIYHYDVDGTLSLGNEFAKTIIDNGMLGYTSTPSSVPSCHDNTHTKLVNGYCLECQTLVDQPEVDWSSSGEGKFDTNFDFISMSGLHDFELQFKLEIDKAYPDSAIDGAWAVAGGQNVDTDFYVVTRPDWWVPDFSGNILTAPGGSKIADANNIERNNDISAYANFDEWKQAKAKYECIITYRYQALSNVLRIDYVFISKVDGFEDRVSKTSYKLFVSFTSGEPYNPVYCKVGVHWCKCKLTDVSLRGFYLGWYGHA